MDIQNIDLRRGDFEGMHPKAKLFSFDEDKKLYTGDGVESINDQWTTWCACIGMLHLDIKEAQVVPDLSELQERIAGHQYYHDEHGHMIVDMDDVVKEISGFDSWKAQAVPEGFVLIKDDTKTVVVIERMVEQQVEASGMDSRRLERLDGWKIIEAAVKAQEPTND